MNDRPPTDYAANRGPLDGREYVRRRPDPISAFAGCLVLLVVLAGTIVIVAFGLATLGVVLLTIATEIRVLLGL